MYFLSVSSSRTQTQRGFLCLSTSVTLFLKFYSRCLGLCFTFTFKGIYLWVVDCWSLFISRSALRGYAAQSGSSLSSACHSARRPASLDCRRREGGKSTWPKACQYTPRGGNKAEMTAWWHLLLCIISFYQSSAFHLCEPRHSNAKCQACWPS